MADKTTRYGGRDIVTSIAGVNIGDDRQLRQEALQILQEHKQQHPKDAVFLDLVPEPENPFDKDAIQVLVNIPELGGRVQLGYIRNRPQCPWCNREFKSEEVGRRCPNCHQGTITRDGLASQLRRTQREDPTRHYYGMVSEVTGGTGAKTIYGCNIIIKQRILTPDPHG